MHPSRSSGDSSSPPSGSIGIKFIRKFTVPGNYKFVCTLHRATMQMTVTVKKPS